MTEAELRRVLGTTVKNVNGPTRWAAPEWWIESVVATLRSGGAFDTPSPDQRKTRAEAERVAVRVHGYVNACDEQLLDAMEVDGHFAAPAPAYTSSLDAALTLVPEGCAWEVTKLLDDRAPQAKIQKRNPPTAHRDDNGFAIWVDVEGATPAIALAIAALRARGL